MSPEDVKSRSEAFLLDHGIEVNRNLPIIETREELAPQTAEAVATRAVVLCYMIGLGYGQTGERLKKTLIDFDLFDAVSPRERELLEAARMAEQDKINCRWLAECVQSLAYCLGMAELNAFRNCDDDLATKFPPAFTDPAGFIGGATLRPFLDIYQQADVHYRLHWAVRHRRLRFWGLRFWGNRRSLNEEVIARRRRALDWAIGVEADWDEVSLDT